MFILLISNHSFFSFDLKVICTCTQKAEIALTEAAHANFSEIELETV